MTIFNNKPQIYDADGNPILPLTDTELRASPLEIEERHDQTSSFSPDFKNHIQAIERPLIDVSQNLAVRGQVLSDEGSLRDDFIGSSLNTALTGTFTFTNNSTFVEGSGTAFISEICRGSYIKPTASSEADYVQVASVTDDGNLVLETSYTGTTVSGVTAHQSNWKTVTGSGATISVASSLVTIASGTNNGAISYIERTGDYLPYNLQFKSSISQRVANQIATIGMMDSAAAPEKRAVIVFDGAVNTSIKFITASSSAAADTQTTTVTLPNSALTSSLNSYQLDLSGNQATLLINGEIVAAHRDHIPGPYDILNLVSKIENQAVVTNTNLSIDYFYFSNIDQVQVTNDFLGEPVKVQLTARDSNLLTQDLRVDADKSLNINTLNKATTASLATNGATVTMSIVGKSTVTIRITGTWSTLPVCQVSNDNINWGNVLAYGAGGTEPNAILLVNGLYVAPVAGYQFFRIISAFHSSGTVVLELNADHTNNALVKYGVVRATHPSVIGTLSTFTDRTFALPGVCGYGTTQVSDTGEMYSMWGMHYSYTTNNISMAVATERAAVLIDNPSGNTKTVKVRSFMFSATLAGTSIFRIYRAPTVTVNGTIGTIVNHRNTATVASGISIYTLPTVTANGTIFYSCQFEGPGNPTEKNYNYSLWLEPNNKLLVTFQHSTVGQSMMFGLDFAEVK